MTIVFINLWNKLSGFSGKSKYLGQGRYMSKPNIQFRSQANHFFYIIIFILFFSSFGNTPAEVRYVSHNGSNTPPYLTWETAAELIMSAINISSYGDTIYVARGTYEEQVIMIPGLTLIGAGMDSSVISFQELDIAAITVTSSCVFKGFKIILPDTIGSIAVDVTGDGSEIADNYILNAARGIRINDVDSRVYGNLMKNIYTVGIDILNSNSVIRKNIIDVGQGHPMAGTVGIYIEAFDFNDMSVIDSNIIYIDKSFGIFKSSRAKSLIKNNFIYAYPATGIIIINCDSVMIYNNLIYAGEQGITSLAGDFSRIYNNYIYGPVTTGITGSSDDTLKNNVITDAELGIDKDVPVAPIVKYNDLWRTDSLYAGFTVDSTNHNVNPMIVNEDPSQGKLDFHLQKYSPLIDAGDPDVLDKDGTRSDIGLYGGPYGEVYTYNDLAPRPPHNVTASIDDGFVKLLWDKNTEADLSYYRVYRDTLNNFIYDSTKIVGETQDTVFFDDPPPFNGEKNYYYLITAVDNQGNQSQPGEEVSILVTGLKDQPPVSAESYKLLCNYPNPFNPSTIIPYRLKEAGYVKLYVYDIKGELVKVLVNQWQNKGYHEVLFQPSFEERGKASGMNIPMGPSYGDLASGVYLYQIMVKDGRNIPVFTDIGKMILLK